MKLMSCWVGHSECYLVHSFEVYVGACKFIYDIACSYSSKGTTRTQD